MRGKSWPVSLKAGYGARDITPPVGTELGGYGYYLSRKANEILDRLHTRAVVFEQGPDNERYAIIVSDLVQHDWKLIDKVRGGLAGMGVNSENIMITATHSHTTPVVGMIEGCGAEDAAYVGTLAGKIIGAVEDAVADLKPVVSVRPSDMDITPISHNRADPDGPVDAHVRGALIGREGGRDIAIISYACHPVSLGVKWACSADYPGRAVKALNGRGMDAVFLTGACGDINPNCGSAKWELTGTEETIDIYGRALADGFLDGLQPDAPVPAFTHTRLDMVLNNTPITKEIIEAEIQSFIDKEGTDAPAYGVMRAWADTLSGRLDNGENLSADRFGAPVFILWPLVIAALPFETFTYTAELLRAALPDGAIGIVPGCADQTIAYLPTVGEYERKAYSAYRSIFIYRHPFIAPGEAERIGTEVGERITEFL